MNEKTGKKGGFLGKIKKTWGKTHVSVFVSVLFQEACLFVNEIAEMLDKIIPQDMNINIGFIRRRCGSAFESDVPVESVLRNGKKGNIFRLEHMPAVLRHHGDTQSGKNEFGNGLRIFTVGNGMEIDALLLTVGENDITYGKSVGKRNEIGVEEILQIGEGAACIGIVAPYGQYQRFPEKSQRGFIFYGSRAGGQYELRRRRIRPVLHRSPVGVVLHDIDMDVGAVLLESTQKGDNDQRSRIVGKRDGMLLNGLCILEGLFHFFQIMQENGGVIENNLSVRSEADIPAVPLKKRNAQLLLHTVDDPGKGGLCDMKLLCRMGQMLQLCYFSEI